VVGVIEKVKTQKGIQIEHAVVDGANHFFDGRVETFGALPAVGNGWMELTLFIRTGRAGRVELHADGRPVAAVTGALGDANPRERQYFKIGPYRNKAAEPAAMEFARFRRGAVRADLDD
jgi:hypothetical protein